MLLGYISDAIQTYNLDISHLNCSWWVNWPKISHQFARPHARK